MSTERRAGPSRYLAESASCRGLVQTNPTFGQNEPRSALEAPRHQRLILDQEPDGFGVPDHAGADKVRPPGKTWSASTRIRRAIKIATRRVAANPIGTASTGKAAIIRQTTSRPNTSRLR